jgi:hypothetical protein
MALSTIGLTFWTLQAASLGILMAELVCVPLSIDTTRSYLIDYRIVSAVIALSFSLLIVPRLTATVVGLSTRFSEQATSQFPKEIQRSIA